MESVARSTINANIPSLIELLGSPLLLEPIAKQQKVPLSSLIGGLSITASGGPQSSTGVLNVSLFWNDPVEGRRILTALAENYPNYALEQRQEKLGQGLAFLDQQAPALQQRVATLQDSLKRFRESNGFLEPSVQGAAIIGERDGLLSSLRSLQVQQSTLETQLASVRSGRLVDLGVASISVPIRTTPANSGLSGSSAQSAGAGSGLQRGPLSQGQAPNNLGLSTAPRAEQQMPASGTTETPKTG